MASSVLEDFLADLWHGYFAWYAARIFDETAPANLLSLLVAVLVFYILLMLLGAIFPFVDRLLLNLLFLPFTVIHVWITQNSVSQPLSLTTCLPGSLDPRL